MNGRLFLAIICPILLALAHSGASYTSTFETADNRSRCPRTIPSLAQQWAVDIAGALDHVNKGVSNDKYKKIYSLSFSKCRRDGCDNFLNFMLFD